jgi:hypothetical protein
MVRESRAPWGIKEKNIKEKTGKKINSITIKI